MDYNDYFSVDWFGDIKNTLAKNWYLNVEESCLMDIDTKNYLIIGAGASGLSVVKYLSAHAKQFRIMDTREIPPNANQIKSILSKSCISFGELNHAWIEQADVIILSPGVAPQIAEIQHAKKLGVEVIGDIELFAKHVDKPYIAVTGSNGKSTVATLVSDIINSQGKRAKACANIGEPALNVINDDVDVFVLELSSFQLETCQSLSPFASTVLNISDDHLDRHETIEQYASIKASIYNNAENKILPRDIRAIKHLSNYQADITFGLDAPSGNHYGVLEDESGRWLVQGHRKIINSSELPLMGEVGELNVLAALAIAQNFIHDEAKAVQAIKHFQGLAHRCQLIAEHNRVLWIDDSKGTNVGATVSAIRGFSKPLILIVGGIHKGGSLTDLCAAVKSQVDYVIAYGQDRQIFLDALSKDAEVIEATSLSECVALARQVALPGAAVLFSPACASFDMFANYIERGLAFKSAVQAQLSGGPHG